MSFDESFSRVVGIEGHYSNDPNDAGGETAFGVTAAVARRFGYVGPMASMPLGVAQDIYRRGWWDRMHLEEVTNVAGARIADELFECGVNVGQFVAGRFLQRALNAFNVRGTQYPDLLVDGDIGAKTIDALRAFITRRKVLGETVLLNALNSQQGVYYIERGEARPANEDFVFGWFANRVRIA